MYITLDYYFFFTSCYAVEFCLCLGIGCILEYRYLVYFIYNSTWFRIFICSAGSNPHYCHPLLSVQVEHVLYDDYTLDHRL